MTSNVSSKLEDRKENRNRPKILLVTSSLLVDRVFIYTNLIKSLEKFGEVIIWSASRGNDQNSSVWSNTSAQVEKLPAIGSFKEIPHNYLRRLNEFAWDFRFQIPSRMSMMRHVRNKKMPFSVRALKLPARILAMCHAEQIFEDKLEKILVNYPRSVEAEERLREMQPAAVVVTGAFQFEQPAIYAAAKKLGIPTLAYIPSWDNLTTKNRLVFKYDGYIVWSEQIKKELHEFYPATENLPVYVVGAPQFDIFFQTNFHQSREEFCRQQNLRPELPIIVYAVGSPNFLQEHHGAIDLAKRVVRGELGNVQMLVRPHPIHDNAELTESFKEFAPLVRLQQTINAGKAVSIRSQDEDQIREWINTFRHADVVVNLSSTVTIDAAIFDKPVVNLDFDPQPGQADQQLIKEINHEWDHFKPVAESGGVMLVNNFEEVAEAVKNYLTNPHLHSAERKWMTNYVCGYLDGRCGERFAEAIADFSTRNMNADKITADVRQNISVKSYV